MRSLSVKSELCHHEAVLNVRGYGDAVPVPAFGPQMGAHMPVCPRWGNNGLMYRSKGIVQSLSFQRVICSFIGCLPSSSAAS